MWPLWVWLSRLTITENMDKKSCQKHCSDQGAKLITVGHLEYASEFKVLFALRTKNLTFIRFFVISSLDRMNPLVWGMGTE